jgi:hypothetical protein
VNIERLVQHAHHAKLACPGNHLRRAECGHQHDRAAR